MRISDRDNWLFSLLKYGLFGLPLNRCPENLSDWQSVIGLRKQAVLPMVLQAAMNCPGAQCIDQDDLSALKMEVYRQVAYNQYLLSSQWEISQLLDGEKIAYAVLKGASVSANYPKPEMRMQGDIDILFRPEECKKASELICGIGYRNREMNLSIHEVLSRGLVRVEPHYKIVDLPESAAGDSIASALSSAVDRAEQVTIDGYTFSVLSPVHQAITLLLHMNRHITRDGIGLRHVCDWAAFIDQRVDHEIWRCEIQLVLSQCGLLRFAKLMTRTCVVYLGLPAERCRWCMDVPVSSCERLIWLVLKRGNMGQKQAELNIATQLSSEKDKRRPHRTLLGTLFGNIHFIVKRDYPVCRKLPVLYPLFWAYIPVRHVIRKRMRKEKSASALQTFIAAYRQKKLYNDMRMYLPDL